VQHALAPVQTLIPELVQQMIILALFALWLLCKPLSTSSLWYFYSRASNHMTNNAVNLTNVTKYYGNLQILTIDGSHLPIIAVSDISSFLSDVFFFT